MDDQLCQEYSRSWFFLDPWPPHSVVMVTSQNVSSPHAQALQWSVCSAGTNKMCNLAHWPSSGFTTACEWLTTSRGKYIPLTNQTHSQPKQQQVYYYYYAVVPAASSHQDCCRLDSRFGIFLCEVCSPCACVGFLQVLPLPSTVQKWACPICFGQPDI